MDFHDRHVLVTGGTGALGTAVVGTLIERGARCHVPYLVEKEAEHFAFRDHVEVELIAGGDLSDEAAVARVFDAVPRLWASIHIAGGFAAAPVRDTAKADLMRQVDMNFVTCFLCCRAAVKAMAAGRRMAGASSTWRRARRSNGAAAPAWPPTRRARPRSPR